MTTTPEAVDQLSKIFAEIEDQARKIKLKSRSARKLIDVINKNGDIGGIESQASSAKMDVLATCFEADIWKLHGELTAIAQARGIDLPALRSGGGTR